jgi:hypothetical protein
MAPSVRSIALIIAGGLLFSASTSPARADEECPVILQIDLYLESGWLTGDVTATGLLSDRIVGTIQSGLPAVVELFYLLVESGGGTVAEGMQSYSLEYDVWDDRYFVKSTNSRTPLPTLEAMRSMVEGMRNISLVPVDRMIQERSYFVRMSVAVNPIQGTDKRRMEGWVRENVKSGTEDSWHEQVLNVNDLISHFFSREEGSARISEWFDSPLFRPSELSIRHEEEG